MVKIRCETSITDYNCCSTSAHSKETHNSHSGFFPVFQLELFKKTEAFNV